MPLTVFRLKEGPDGRAERLTKAEVVEFHLEDELDASSNIYAMPLWCLPLGKFTFDDYGKLRYCNAGLLSMVTRKP
ncbi:MAG: hypothetical protein AB1401_03240 [Thermodesulfobacteriota bacterium]